jgi:hypothetical protein
MRLQLSILACTGSIIFGIVQGSPVPAAAALSAIPIGCYFGTLDQKKRSPDIEAIRIKVAAAASHAAAANCELRLSEQRSRIASQANEQLLQEITKVRAEVAAATAAQWKAHCDRIEAAATEVRAELETVRAEAEKAARRHRAEIDRLGEISAAEAAAATDRHNAEIEKLNERLGKLEATAEEYRRRQSAITRAEDRITEFRANEKVIRAEIKHQAAATENQKRTIATLQNELRSMQSAAIQQYNDGLKIGSANGQAAAAEAFRNELERRQLKIEQLETKIERLEVALKGKADRDRFDKSLPELADILTKAHKPIAVEGSQGSGKALAIANAISAYAGSLGSVVMVLDVSEADDPDSSWRRLGIPCTGDPLAFADFIEAAAEALASRPHRNNRAEYDQSPPVFAVVDEAMCAFDSLDEDTIKERIRKPLRALESRGHKRKVFPIVATQDGQIQNLKANGVTLWNTGTLKNYYKVLLNDGLRESLSDTELDRDPDLARFIESFDGKFIAAIESVTGRGKRKQPIKHPSHHGLDLRDTVPCRGVESITIAAAPKWLPASCRAAYSEFAAVQDSECGSGATAAAEGAFTAACTAAEALPDLDCAESITPRSPAALAQKHGLSEDDVIALLDAIDDGRSMTAAVTSIAPKSSSKTSKYARARELFLSLKDA